MNAGPTDQYVEPEGDVRVRLHEAGDLPGLLVLAVAGAVDLLTSGQVADAVTAALTRRPQVLVVDLSEVSFLDSTGLSVLAQAHAAGPATALRVVAPEDGMPRRAITLTGMNSLLQVFPTRAAALAVD
ncbi:STAS domain-containing protein [Amycolatopsis sp. A133]|uniref:STAS domain-containing protein n=1 Tax=Amycolatopsis sp. A133 TaxID=3064472 RepID=UPI0028005EE0|nr:STAS domain-containing protein [Amycolatopsis sp. A133]MDQ7810714.1 STAS domain-containing protein [Amycolatopsis sp. A133]